MCFPSRARRTGDFSATIMVRNLSRSQRSDSSKWGELPLPGLHGTLSSALPTSWASSYSSGSLPSPGSQEHFPSGALAPIGCDSCIHPRDSTVLGSPTQVVPSPVLWIQNEQLTSQSAQLWIWKDVKWRSLSSSHEQPENWRNCSSF